MNRNEPRENPSTADAANSAELVERYRQGDADAAETLFLRYANRLTALARKNLSPKLSRRFDPEDVVQSAYRSFFIRARDGRFSIQRSGDLWRLLVAITLRKLWRKVDFHEAGMRAIDREEHLALLPSGEQVDAFCREPSAEDVVALADGLEQVMEALGDEQRHVLQLRLCDYTIEEIAAETHRSERTIRRWLDGVKSVLTEKFSEAVS